MRFFPSRELIGIAGGAVFSFIASACHQASGFGCSPSEVQEDRTFYRLRAVSSRATKVKDPLGSSLKLILNYLVRRIKSLVSAHVGIRRSPQKPLDKLVRGQVQFLYEITYIGEGNQPMTTEDKLLSPAQVAKI